MNAEKAFTKAAKPTQGRVKPRMPEPSSGSDIYRVPEKSNQIPRRFRGQRV